MKTLLSTLLALSIAGTGANAADQQTEIPLTISEQSASIPHPQFMARGMAAMSDSSVPVATGEQELRTTINVTFAIE